ncbi:MAG: hypothetical protein PHV93_01400 [Candidatus Pacebacteria bacterium]|nr:hypothetical protein [Candidatus Paceibacterota bacterium]
MKIPKELLNSKYRRELWKETQKVLKNVHLPVSEMFVMGSFSTKKKRPADVDFLVILKTPKQKKKDWSVDFVLAPDNKHGDKIIEDARLWMKQKYGKKFGLVRLK